MSDVDYTTVTVDPEEAARYEAFLASIAQSQVDYDAAVKHEADQRALTEALTHLSQKAHGPASNGKAWAKPVGVHDAYPEGAEVTYRGKTWVSTTPFNVWEPDLNGWRVKT